MAIVRYLVELHGGTVMVTSEGENCGATFTARLPLRMAVPTGPDEGDVSAYFEASADASGIRS
jgi:hypothetical protein